MTYEQKTASSMISFMLFVVEKNIKDTSDEQKKIELAADKREMTMLQMQINLNRQEAIDRCIAEYGPVIYQIMEGK